MNNNLLLQAAKWLTELGIRTEPAQTYLKISRDDVENCGLFDNIAGLVSELKIAVSSKIYLELTTDDHYHLNSF